MVYQQKEEKQLWNKFYDDKKDSASIKVEWIKSEAEFEGFDLHDKVLCSRSNYIIHGKFDFEGHKKRVAKYED